MCFERSGFAKIAPMAIRCLRCGTNIQAPAQFCENCAAEQRAAGIFQPSVPAQPGPAVGGAAPMTVTCPACGAQAPADATFCPSCGSNLISGARSYAGFWIRLLALIIDGLVLAIPQVIIALTVSSVGGRLVLNFLTGFLYTVGFWVLEGATPGKMLMGLKITMASGEPLTPGTAIVRYVGYFLSALTLGIGHLIIAFTPEKRGLQDYLAGTVVVRKG